MTRKTSFILLLNALVGCAHVTASGAIPASAPTLLYAPVDTADPTKGYFVSYPAAQTILISQKQQEQQCSLAVLNSQEQTAFCQAELKDSRPNYFSLIGIPILVGLAGIGVGLVAGFAAFHK